MPRDTQIFELKMKKKSQAVISHVSRREIQAPLVSALINGYSDKIGKDRAHLIAKEVICHDAAESGRAMACRFSGNSLQELRRVVEEVWAEDGTLSIENLKLEEKSLEFDVTHCEYAEMYKRMGIRELGDLLSCCRDFAFMDGFNPEIELLRTKTIMQGDAFCDFRYRQK